MDIPNCSVFLSKTTPFYGVVRIFVPANRFMSDNKHARIVNSNTYKLVAEAGFDPASQDYEPRKEPNSSIPQ